MDVGVRYGRLILVVFAAWSAVRVGHLYYLQLGDALFYQDQTFRWHWQIWIFTIFGPDFLYYLGCGVLLQRYFVERQWLRIVLAVAFLETFVIMFATDFFSFMARFEQTPEYSETFLFNVITSRLVPLFAIPLGAFVAKWVADTIERWRISEELE